MFGQKAGFLQLENRGDKVVAGKLSSSPGYLLKIKGSMLPPLDNLIEHSLYSVRNYGQNEFWMKVGKCFLTSWEEI